MADISIIIPCYNAAPYIDRCLTSVINQTLPLHFLQIICVDDASTDDTWQHLQHWEQSYPDNITLVHCETNGMLGTARNIGMQYVDTPWVSFIDADDWIEPNYYEKMFSIALQCDCDMVSCQMERDPSPDLTYLTHTETGKDSGLIVISNTIQRRSYFISASTNNSAWGKLIRTDILKNNDIYFPNHLAYEDNYWAPLLYLSVNRIYLLEEKLYHYYVNPKSITLTKDADYHIDLLTVNIMKWQELKKRNLFKDYKSELEYNFIDSCYFSFVRILVLRYQIPSYSLFQLCKNIVLEHIPDYHTNPYATNMTKDFYKLVLEALETPISKSEFYDLVKYAREYWLHNL
ncbi:MAG: glycosyltransferase family 2 protein [Bacillota bacterium]|nr:glycosyltransferase family 2 protein [Bacillota bacterium]